MAQEKKTPSRSGGVWPGVIAPLGLSALLGVAVTFFVAKVDADRERAADAADRLESYARMEAGELAGRSRELVRAMVEEREHSRRNRHSNLRMEVRAVMEAVNTFLSSSLEKSRAASVRRREVGDFPSGFEGVKTYLELSSIKPESDPHVEALRGSAPELAMLLPAGASLSVVENNYREILSLGGGLSADHTLSESMTRDFFWDDGGRGRHWALHLRISAADDYPHFGPEEIAHHLSERLGGIRLDGVEWHGWLSDASGRQVAAFPGLGGGDGAAFFPATASEWTSLGGNRYALLERAEPIPGQNLGTAVSVIVSIPEQPGTLVEEFMGDGKWSATIGALGLFSLIGWIWFLRTVFLPRAGVAPAPRPQDDPARPRRRLVRDGAAPRAVPEAQEVILADIDDEGEVTVEAVPHTVPVRATPHKTRQPIPSGSLARLQAIHRGGSGMRSSRILDGARSQVLRELAVRIRPVLHDRAGLESGGPDDSPHGGKDSSISFTSPPLGWKRVE